MPFEFKKVLEHGTTNPIVARLSLQILQILKQCNASEGLQAKVGDLYINSLQKKLLRCWGIEDRFKKEFAAAIGKYKPPAAANAPVEIPQIARLDEECHNFLYEAKNFIRDLLQVVNLLYGTTFEEASEFSRAKKGSQSLVEFAEKTFGANDGKTKMLEEAVPMIEELISMRNAVEHPEGLSGKLVIANFTLGADRKLDEPTWHREKNGKAVGQPSSIRADMQTCIQNSAHAWRGCFRVVGLGSSSGRGHDAHCIHPGGTAQPGLPDPVHRHSEPASRRFAGRREQKQNLKQRPRRAASVATRAFFIARPAVIVDCALGR
jgi:hypothetical protein